MKLTVTNRAGGKKSELKQLRREGKIPAILYAPERPCESIVIDAAEMNAILREMKPGRLPTTVFTLKFGNKERRAIIKDIQYNIISYEVAHIDFVELIDGVPVSVKVPVNFTGVAECNGIKLGGFLRQVIRHVKVQCEPKHIPEEFILDVRELGIKQTKRVSDIAIPKGVKPLAKLEEVVVVISKR